MTLSQLKAKTLEASQVLHEAEASLDLAGRADDMSNILTHLEHASVAARMATDCVLALLEEARRAVQH